MRIKRIALFFIALLLALPTYMPVARAAQDMPYRIEVDLVNQIVTVFTNDGNDDIVLQCLCSSGANHATPTGTFTMPEKKRDTERTEWFHFRAYGGYARYASRIHKEVMFHSLLYKRPNEKYISQQSVKDYGYAVSHGCVRLRVEDAKFIAENCLPGTKVKIHNKGERDNDLRELLFQSSFHAYEGQTYNQFQGIPDEPGILGKGSSGDEVKELQAKLKALGIYTGEIDGKYTLSTVKAVRQAQKLLGVEQTGAATLEFQEAIARPDAPSAMEVSLTEGRSGPAVRALQLNLQALKLYDGDADTVYDIDVINAVKTFQSVYGFKTDGVASPLLQKAAYYEAGRLKGIFAGQGDYSAEIRERTVYYGRVNCQVGIKLRKEPNTKSEALMSLRNGTTVVGVEAGKEWSQVSRNGVNGYVKNSYMEYYPQTVLSVDYIGPDGAVKYTMGSTDDRDSPAVAFEEYLASGGSLDEYSELSEFATLLEAQPLRANPNEAAETLADIPDGEDVQVLLKGGEWSLVSWNDAQGYIANPYLEFWKGVDIEADDVEVYEDDTMETAAIAPQAGDSANVYEAADESSAVIGSLPANTPVSVVETTDGWSLIDYKGHQGYVKELELQFTNE